MRKCIHAKASYNQSTLNAAGLIYCCNFENSNSELINTSTAAFIISNINWF